MILFLATSSNSAWYQDTRVFLDPKSSGSWRALADACPVNLRTKHSLSLVSSRLRALSAEFLYRALHLSMPAVRKIVGQIGTGRVESRHIRHLSIRYTNRKSGSLPDVVKSVVDMLKRCVGLQCLDLCDFLHECRQDTMEENLGCLYNLWDAIPSAIRTMAVSSLNQIPFLTRDDVPGLQTFLRKHEDLERWEIGVIRHPSNLFPHMELFSNLKSLSVGNVVNQWGLAPVGWQFPLVTEMEIAGGNLSTLSAMSFPALKHVHIVSLSLYENLSHILCDSPELLSLVCNVTPYDLAEVCVWDTHSRASPLEEITIGIATMCDDTCWRWRMNQVVRVYSSLKKDKNTAEDSEKDCLEQAQGMVYDLFGALLNPECYPRLRSIKISIPVSEHSRSDLAWDEVCRFIIETFTCLQRDWIVLSVCIQSF